MEFTRAGLAQLPEVLDLMREFYPLERLALNEAVAANGLLWVMADAARGAIFLIRVDGEAAGYCALTAGVSLEFGGPYLLVDELYIRQRFQGRGLGSEAMKMMEAFAQKAECGALRVEVHDVNERAKRLYLGRGFLDDRRWIFTKPF